MIIGSHNSMTYLNPKYIWGWVMIPFARCQSKSWMEQYNAGIRCFDLRVKIDRLDNCFTFAHGLLMLKGSVISTIQDIVRVAKGDNNTVYFRIIYEGKFRNNDDKNRFVELCSMLDKLYGNFFEGREKKGWNLVYDFEYKPKLTQYVSSMAPDVRWYEKAIPWLYAKRKNKDNIPCEDITLYDFI